MTICENEKSCQQCVYRAMLWGMEYCALEKSPTGKNNMKPCEMYTNN